MKHKSSQIVFAHWAEKRASRALPERSAIDPGGIRSALSDTFILSFNRLTHHPFRLAGTRICALFGRELRGSAFTALWEPSDRGSIDDLVRAAADDSLGLVAAASGRGENGQTVDLELLLLPLMHHGQTHVRMIGALAPLVAPYWLGLHRVTALALGGYRFIADHYDQASPALAPTLPENPPRLRRGLMVYDGGQN